MRQLHSLVSVAVLLLAVATPPHAAASSAAADQPIAPKLRGVGHNRWPITTANQETQAFFDQGLNLIYAFNHQEAIRAFQEASRLDQTAPMPYWGLAYALGPNINDPMPRERELEALAALDQAISRRDAATTKERELIAALETRYGREEGRSRADLDQAFKAAMRDLAQRHQDDPDIRTLYASSILETMPWHYWTKDGRANPGTNEAIAELEAVMAAHPTHTGAHHYYIHAVEASQDPDRGLPSADALGDLAPAAGHLVHMPAHIYIRTGHYARASASNERAILADEDYLAQCRAQGLYPLAYYPHNIHFLWAASTLEGRKQVALQAAAKTAGKGHHEMAPELPPLQGFQAAQLFAWVRFGEWQQILVAPEPGSDLRYVHAMWHYARGMAYAAQKNTAGAKSELRAIARLLRDPRVRAMTIDFTPAPRVLELARHLVAGELASRGGRHRRAIRELTAAVAVEDAFDYSEPPTWHQPPRHNLGAALLAAGEPAQAEAVYREDLLRLRENGWALFGLAQSLEAQGKHDQAQEAKRRFAAAFAAADVTLTASRF